MTEPERRPPNSLSPAMLRTRIIDMAWAGNSVHIGCAFSIVEILCALFGGVMNLRGGPGDGSRDRLVLSKGHGVMALYAAYVQIGWLPEAHLRSYFADGSMLHGLAEARIPLLEVSSGTLGHGLPIAVGMALGFGRSGNPARVFCIVGDGEMNEGPMWEGLLFAGHHKLANLTVVVDANGQQAMGRTSEVLDLEPLAEKFRAFGFHALECDGHDPRALDRALGGPAAGKPRAVIARTIKGRGVSFMEDNNEWHYRRLTQELLEQARRELAEVDRARPPV